MKVNNLPAYDVIISKHIEEVNSQAYLLKHKKTGARIVVLSNDDDNKVFNIGFRTPVTDDTGVPHIIEHTVLCGKRTVYGAGKRFFEYLFKCHDISG